MTNPSDRGLLPIGATADVTFNGSHMDFSLTDEQKLLRESVTTLMARVAKVEQVRDYDRNQTFPYDLYDAWVEAGLLRLPFPEDYGGLGGSAIDLAIALAPISAWLTEAPFSVPSIFCAKAATSRSDIGCHG